MIALRLRVARGVETKVETTYVSRPSDGHLRFSHRPPLSPVSLKKTRAPNLTLPFTDFTPRYEGGGSCRRILSALRLFGPAVFGRRLRALFSARPNARLLRAIPCARVAYYRAGDAGDRRSLRGVLTVRVAMGTALPGILFPAITHRRGGLSLRWQPEGLCCASDRRGQGPPTRRRYFRLDQPWWAGPVLPTRAATNRAGSCF